MANQNDTETICELSGGPIFTFSLPCGTIRPSASRPSVMSLRVLPRKAMNKSV